MREPAQAPHLFGNVVRQRGRVIDARVRLVRELRRNGQHGAVYARCGKTVEMKIRVRVMREAANMVRATRGCMLKY